jgi:hypothetical protein
MAVENENHERVSKNGEFEGESVHMLAERGRDLNGSSQGWIKERKRRNQSCRAAQCMIAEIQS